MAAGPELRTPRLRLRRWRDTDIDALAQLNADPRVMEFFPRPYTREESAAMLDRIEAVFTSRGFGVWAVELGDGTFIGLTGLNHVDDMPFPPAVELAWRLLPEFWGRGYATEAAEASRGFAYESLGLEEVVAYTAAINRRSRAVMTRLQMTHDPAEDFDHPRVPEGPLRRHVVYRSRR